MTTENFDLKVGDVIVGNDGMGDRIGYYRETKNDKSGIRVIYTNSKSKSTGVFSRAFENIRLATPEEIAEFEA